MLNRTRNQPAIDTLIVEPSFECTRNCKGCYQKGRALAGPPLSTWDLGRIVKHIANRGKGLARSFILSCNDTTGDDLGQQKRFVGTLNYHLEDYAIACRSKTTALKAMSHMYRYTGDVYLSTIRKGNNGLRDLRHKMKMGRKIVLNLQTGPKLSNHRQAANKLMKQIEAARESNVDEVHILMPKRHPDISNTYIEDLRIVYSILEAEKSDHINLTLDRCVKEGHCGANTTSLVLWPDGSIAGCPYAMKADTPPADTPEGVIKNMQLALEKETCDTPACVARNYQKIGHQGRLLDIFASEL